MREAPQDKSKKDGTATQGPYFDLQLGSLNASEENLLEITYLCPNNLGERRYQAPRYGTALAINFNSGNLYGIKTSDQTRGSYEEIGE